MSIKQVCDQYYRVVLTCDAAVNARTQKEAYEQALEKLKLELTHASSSLGVSCYATSREVQECEIRNCDAEATYKLRDAGYFCEEHYGKLTANYTVSASSK